MKKGNIYNLKNINYKKENNILSVVKLLLALFVQGVSVQGVICPMG